MQAIFFLALFIIFCAGCWLVFIAAQLKLARDLEEMEDRWDA